jgi:hypothetical protein
MASWSDDEESGVSGGVMSLQYQNRLWILYAWSNKFLQRRLAGWLYYITPPPPPPCVIDDWAWADTYSLRLVDS